MPESNPVLLVTKVEMLCNSVLFAEKYTYNCIHRQRKSTEGYRGLCARKIVTFRDQQMQEVIVALCQCIA